MTPPATFTVGVTGHRPNRLAIGEERARRRIALVLRSIRRGTRGRGLRRVARTGLAEGADRLFAESALQLGFRLEAVLPFASSAYETTFSDPSATAGYRSLLAAAGDVEILPGTLADTKSAYEAAGRRLADRCDLLLAVWDGQPAAGRGGTPEIIAYALGLGKSVIWIDAARDRPARLLVHPTGAGRRHVPLTALAARSRPARREDMA